MDFRHAPKVSIGTYPNAKIFTKPRRELDSKDVEDIALVIKDAAEAGRVDVVKALLVNTSVGNEADRYISNVAGVTGNNELIELVRDIHAYLEGAAYAGRTAVVMQPSNRSYLNVDIMIAAANGGHSDLLQQVASNCDWDVELYDLVLYNAGKSGNLATMVTATKLSSNPDIYHALVAGATCVGSESLILGITDALQVDGQQLANYIIEPNLLLIDTAIRLGATNFDVMMRHAIRTNKTILVNKLLSLNVPIYPDYINDAARSNNVDLLKMVMSIVHKIDICILTQAAKHAAYSVIKTDGNKLSATNTLTYLLDQGASARRVLADVRNIRERHVIKLLIKYTDEQVLDSLTMSLSSVFFDQLAERSRDAEIRGDYRVAKKYVDVDLVLWYHHNSQQ